MQTKFSLVSNSVKTLPVMQIGAFVHFALASYRQAKWDLGDNGTSVASIETNQQ